MLLLTHVKAVADECLIKSSKLECMRRDVISEDDHFLQYIVTGFILNL